MLIIIVDITATSRGPATRGSSGSSTNIVGIIVGVCVAIFILFIVHGAHWRHPRHCLHRVVTLQGTSSQGNNHTYNNVISTNYQSEPPAMSTTTSSTASNSTYSTPMATYPLTNTDTNAEVSKSSFLNFCQVRTTKINGIHSDRLSI